MAGRGRLFVPSARSGIHLLARVRQEGRMSPRQLDEDFGGTSLGLGMDSEIGTMETLVRRPAGIPQGGGTGRSDQEETVENEVTEVESEVAVKQDEAGEEGSNTGKPKENYSFPPSPPAQVVRKRKTLGPTTGLAHFMRPKRSAEKALMEPQGSPETEGIFEPLPPAAWNDEPGNYNDKILEGTKASAPGLFSGMANAVEKVWSLLGSPSKKLIAQPGQPSRLPKTVKDGHVVKDKARIRLKTVLGLARNSRNRDKVITALEEDFSSNTSRKSQGAIRATVKAIFEKDGNPALPPSVEKLKWLAGTLKAAEYKAASIYLGQYKLMAIEAGEEWPPQLARTLDLCKRSVKRASGPGKKAKEVETFEEGDQFTQQPKDTDKLKVTLAKELFEFGVMWMLREVELAAIELPHIQMDFESKCCTFTLPVSKVDQRGQSTKRMLQCLCSGVCSTSCPFHVALKLLDGMARLSTRFANVTKEGKRGTKGQLVRDWKIIYGKETTGHSARRTGALRYIKLGWSISQVAYLGRWSSSIIYQYASEALSSMPVNDTKAFQGVMVGEQTNQGGKVATPSWAPSLEDVKAQLATEVEAIRLDQKATLDKLDQEVKVLKERAEKGSDKLPPFVQHYNSKVVHYNSNLANCSPPFAWKTLCGWSYYQSDFLFISGKGEQQLCRKCLELAQSK